MESGPDGGKGPFGRVRGGDQPVRGDLPKIEVLGVDHGADQTGRGAEPKQRARRRFDRDAHAERRAGEDDRFKAPRPAAQCRRDRQAERDETEREHDDFEPF
ncbi:hypothetical protein [Streptomyces sp. NPDC004721]